MIGRKRKSVLRTILLAGVAAGALSGATRTVTVSGLADIWLAGQPNGTVANGGYSSVDTAPTHSPVLASTGLTFTVGSYVTISATGSTSWSACSSPTPDGDGGCGIYSTPSPALGIGTYAGPVNALVGVFIGPTAPGGTAPAGLNFATAGATAQTTLTPQLNQVFFIGDGLTGNGSGTAQQFVIPAGATRLYLGSSDGVGANYDDSGSFTVTITDAPVAAPAPTAPAGAPAASALSLALAAMMLIGAGGYLLNRRSQA
jgi:hypothetical protein